VDGIHDFDESQSEITIGIGGELARVSLAQDLSFRTRKYREQTGHRAASGCGQIQQLTKRNRRQDNSAPEGGQLIRYRPAPAIQAPHHHYIDFPPSRRLQQLQPAPTSRRHDIM
jgi:hypothetical protein